MVFGGIQSRGSNPFDILGDGTCYFFLYRLYGVSFDGAIIVWLKSVYVVFDQGNTRIGVAQRS